MKFTIEVMGSAEELNCPEIVAEIYSALIASTNKLAITLSMAVELHAPVLEFSPANPPKSNVRSPAPNVVEPHKWPDLSDSNSSNGSDDPFAVDWSKAPDDATHHAFDSAEKELKGHWYKGHPAKDNEEFLSHGDAYHIKASGFILPAGLADRWHESLTKRHVHASISTTESIAMLRDQAN